MDVEQATLAHGDFDTTHIFQQEGRYTGIIDFGEIRGIDIWYDLGHFALHDGERLPVRLLPALLQGYAEVKPLPVDAHDRIHFSGLLIGLRTLAHLNQRGVINQYTDHFARFVRQYIHDTQAES